MRVLLVKLSSLGDLVHTFPALSDAAAAIDGLTVDWVVEEGFAEVPVWHQNVDRVVPVGLRRWRRDWRKALRRGEFQALRGRLRERPYDLVLDAQGLLKSAVVARLANAPVSGFDRRSAREPLAAVLYRSRRSVGRDLHAVDRLRQLFAGSLGYAAPSGEPDFGLRFSRVKDVDRPQLVLLHGTTWASKHWPEPYWAELVHVAAADGFASVLPWGDPDDRLRAERIISAAGAGELMPSLGLTDMAKALARCSVVVGVDSGLAHIAAAVGVPAVTLYGPTRTGLTGAVGPHQRNLAAAFECAPCMRRTCNYTGSSTVRPACFESLTPTQVWQAARHQLEAAV